MPKVTTPVTAPLIFVDGRFDGSGKIKPRDVSEPKWLL